MIGYFTDCPLFVQDFKDWVEDEFHLCNGWRINHTQYMGNKFFFIEFKDVEDQDTALDSASWFYSRKYLYTFPWILDFDVTMGHHNMLPIWIKISYCSPVLKIARFKLAKILGKVLLYIRGMNTTHTPMIKPVYSGTSHNKYPKASKFAS